MTENYPSNINKIYYKNPNGQIKRNFVLSTNFTLGEFYDAMFIRPNERASSSFIPMHKNMVEALQLLRTTLGTSIKISSQFRSQEHEAFKNRDGTSQHTKGLAVDVVGLGLPDLIELSIDSKNGLYDSLRLLGVNAFGIYDDFVHLDFRPNKPNGDIYFWNNKKKSGDLEVAADDVGSTKTNYLKFIWIPILIILVFPILKKVLFFKKRYKEFKTKF